MRQGKLWVLTVAASVALMAGCSADAPTEVVEAAPEPVALTFVGPSGLEQESEAAAQAVLAAQAQAAAEAAAAAEAQAAAEAEAQRAAEEAAAAAAQEAAEQAAAEAAESADENFDDGYVSDGLESACAQGTASIEECYGPGADADGNGVADVNEMPQSSGEYQYEWLCDPASPGYQPEYC